MTWAWSLLIPAPVRPVLPPRTLDPARTRAVVPTRRDWDEARETVEHLLACRPRPTEIVLVDDNEEFDPPAWVRSTPIRLLQYPGNRGPAFARNFGALAPSERAIEWFYFTDTGCSRNPDFFRVLIDASKAATTGFVSIAGPVVGVTSGALRTPINHYMTVEAILNPPMDAHGPQAIITANALVSAHAFRATGGFDLSYPIAAGEDLDLGVRLARHGPILWDPRAAVRHAFRECIDDFRRRFVRYGRGAAILETRLLLPSLRPVAFTASDRSQQHLADLQVACMRAGYDAQSETLASAMNG